MRYAIIQNGTVTNVALWDGVTQWEADGELLALEDDSPLSIGWTRNADGEWVSPVPLVVAAPDET